MPVAHLEDFNYVTLIVQVKALEIGGCFQCAVDCKGDRLLVAFKLHLEDRELHVCGNVHFDDLIGVLRCLVERILDCGRVFHS